MHVFKKKKYKRNKDSHVKKFNQLNFNFVNNSQTENLKVNPGRGATNPLNLQGIFIVTITTLFLYSFFSLVYYIVLKEFNYDVLLDVSNLVGSTHSYNCHDLVVYDLDADDLPGLRTTLNKIRIFSYCL